MIKFRHTASRLFALLVSLTASGLLYAETITLQALDDFPSIDSGEVPYSAENGRGALQINASVKNTATNLPARQPVTPATAQCMT